MKIIPIILSGGVGSRLWPLSREHFPKQCLPLADNKYSLLQQTVIRVQGFKLESSIIVCNEDHRFLIAQQLQALGVKDAKILLEPASRNTAPAIALAALEVKSQLTNSESEAKPENKNKNDALLLVLPSDHVIDDLSVFENALQQAKKLAEAGSLVTFGIKPTRPETGYGYIRAGDDFAVSKFVEKPNAAKAQEYVSAGDYLWNSGMFLFGANAYLQELEQYRTDVHESVNKSYKSRKGDMDFIRVGVDEFEQCPSVSIDYAVMEKTKNAKVIPYDGGWSDIGAWNALYDYADKDESHNVLLGDVMIETSEHCLIRAESRLVAAINVKDLIIIETKDAVLVMDKDSSQDVKKIVARIKNENRQEHLYHKIVHRPWGTYETLNQGHRYQVKHIVVKPGEKLSVQMHHHRAEHWVVVSGTAKVTNGDKEILLTENQSTYIPVGTIHSLENPGKIPLELVEVQSGSYLDEDDIVRFTDRYGRSDEKNHL
jgi:mannose-1-phosphate guanylyltransferase